MRVAGYTQHNGRFTRNRVLCAPAPNKTEGDTPGRPRPGISGRRCLRKCRARLYRDLDEITIFLRPFTPRIVRPSLYNARARAVCFQLPVHRYTVADTIVTQLEDTPNGKSEHPLRTAAIPLRSSENPVYLTNTHSRARARDHLT